MRMKNRFSKMGKTLLSAMCLLSMGGITYSCSDDYDLDETMPNFLGGSIYDELKARDFKTVVRLIEDLGYKEVLAKTGSKTLFVADDAAYERFFANNKTWMKADGVTPVKSYEDLSLSQKRWLLNGSMLNSAYVLEMLAHHGEEKNLCLRQMSAATAVDSIRYWKWNELPENLNENETDEEGNVIGDRKFWEKYRNETVGGIYMATDKTAPMLTHFLEGQMKEKEITRGDVAFVLNDKNGWSDKDKNRSYIYGSQVVTPDVTCLNGYFHVLDSVLVTPLNMAEIVRTNGKTDLFSCLLERFSAPYYDYDLTVQYKALHNIDADSVYQKRYISERSIGSSKISVGPDKKSLGDFPYLPFDPGWNEYAPSETISKEKDMGAMFVPTDEAMIQYFVYGAGRVLMDRYAKKDNTEENLKYNLYQIPLDIVQPLIRNLMKDSFIETVPSKYLTIMNDAQDQMFPATNPDYATLDAYKQCFDQCLMANNGVVYVMNRVISPADYASVIAPAIYSKNTQIVKTVARADDAYIQGSSYNDAPLKKYYSTYLKAMQSRFSFFVPTDEGLGSFGIVDPMSLARGEAGKGMWRYWRFAYKNAQNSKLPIRSEAYKYDIETGQNPESDSKMPGAAANTSEPSQDLGSGPGLIKKSLLIDMMDQHIVVHETGDTEGINSSRTFFTSRGGAPVVVLNKGNQKDNGKGMVVNGGFQHQLNHDEFADNNHDCVVKEGYDLTAETNGYGNGMTYMLDRPMQATTRSVYNVLSSDKEHFSEFFNLCNSSFGADDLELIGLKDPEWGANSTEWNAEQNKYRIFAPEKMNGYNSAVGEKLIRFFNNYRYTIYVPTNEAIQKAYAAGLPTVADIEAFIEKNTIASEEEGGKPTMAPENQVKAQAMITMLVNFVKYHFQDQAFYVDNAESEGTYQTSCVDIKKNVYLNIHLKQVNGKLIVTDNDNMSEHLANGQQATTVEINNNDAANMPFNVLARDANFDKAVSSTATSVKNSSYVVLHQIPTVLNFAPDFTEKGGRYDSEWATPAKAKAFLAKYRILK